MTIVVQWQWMAMYRLDTSTDTLVDAGTLGAADWHSFNMSPNEKLGYGSSPESDELILVDLTGATAVNIGRLALDPTPGAGNDQPDAIAVRGNTVFVSLRAAGKLAIVKPNQGTTAFLDSPRRHRLTRPTVPVAPYMELPCARSRPVRHWMEWAHRLRCLGSPDRQAVRRMIGPTSATWNVSHSQKPIYEFGSSCTRRLRGDGR